MSERSVTVKSVKDSTCLTFSDVAGESFTAAVASSHFSARVKTSSFPIGPPSVLFDEMEREWRGWERAKTWATLEDELRLTATADRMGHIQLVAEMRNYTAPANWWLAATLHLEAGRLEYLAREINNLFENGDAAF